MTAALVLTALFALLTWGSHRNPARLAGSTDVEDRDAARVAVELRSREPEPVRPREVSARRAATVRLATGSR